MIALAYRAATDQLSARLIGACVTAAVDAVLLPEHPVAEQLRLTDLVRAAGLEQIILLYLEKGSAKYGTPWETKNTYVLASVFRAAFC